MEHEIQHKSQSEMIIPYGAITNNIEISIGDIITTSDFKQMKIIGIDYIHLFSEEAKKCIYDIYKITPEYYAKLWYNKLEYMFHTMILLHLILKEIEDDDTAKTISE